MVQEQNNGPLVDEVDSDVVETLNPDGEGGVGPEGERFGGMFTGLEFSSEGEAHQQRHDESFDELVELMEQYYVPRKKVDTRAQLLTALLIVTENVNNCQAFSSSLVAVALSCGAQFGKKLNGRELFANEVGSNADQFLDRVYAYEDGKAFLSEVASLFRRAAKDERLGRLVAWRESRMSERPSGAHQVVAPIAVPEPIESSTQSVSEVVDFANTLEHVSEAPAVFEEPVVSGSSASAIVLADVQDPKEAGLVLRRWLTTPGSKAEMRLTVREHPDQVLALVQKGDDTGLTSRELADVTEMVIAQLTDDRSSELIRDQLSPQRIAEIASELGDRETALLSFTEPRIVVSALAQHVREIFGRDQLKKGVVDPVVESSAFSSWLGMLRNCQGREDLQELLDYRVGVFCIRDFLLVALLVEAMPQVLVATDESEFSESLGDDDADVGAEPSVEDIEADDDVQLSAAKSVESESLISDMGIRIVASETDIQSVPNDSFTDFEMNPEMSRSRLLSLVAEFSTDLVMSRFVLFSLEDEGSQDVKTTDVSSVVEAQTANVAASLF